MHAWLYVLAVLAILQGVTQVASTGDQTSVSALTTTTTTTSSSSSSRSSNNINFSSISNPDESNHRPSTSDDSVAQSESEVDEDSLERPAAGELHLQTDPFASVVDDDDDDDDADEDDVKDEDDTDSDNSLDFSDSSSSSGSHSSVSDSDSNSKPDPEALVEIEKNLLSLFGFPKRPKIDRTKVVIPEAMKQLYAQIMGHDLVDSVNVPKEGLNTRNANTVRSFTHEGNFLYFYFFSFIHDKFVKFF